MVFPQTQFNLHLLISHRFPSYSSSQAQVALSQELSHLPFLLHEAVVQKSLFLLQPIPVFWLNMGLPRSSGAWFSFTLRIQPLKLCPWIGKFEGVNDTPPRSNGEVKSIDLEIIREKISHSIRTGKGWTGVEKIDEHASSARKECLST
jgi:hypothetical protein